MGLSCFGSLRNAEQIPTGAATVNRQAHDEAQNGATGSTTKRPLGGSARRATSDMAHLFPVKAA